jgi:hypothetical protein
MKTTFRLARLLCVGTVLSLALGVTAFANDDKNVVTQREVQKPKRVIYFVKTTASAVPQPIERLGGIPTTTIPMLVIGDPRISNN